MRTILLADDNPGAVLLCKVELEDEGYCVLVAEDGEEACRVAREKTPDVVILDISMPGVGGMEALGRIKATHPEIPVILFTGFDEDCLRDQRARLAIACVEKRAGDLAELKRAIARALASNKARLP
jgi:two-component system, response regulator, stage 0 sporulation protein F